MEFTQLFKPFEKKPSLKPAALVSVLFRDALSITEWLALGGLLTAASFLIFGRMALLIPTAIVAITIVDKFLMLQGLKSDPSQQGVLLGKYSAQLPGDDGKFGPKPAAKGVTVLLIGAGANHPLGLFAPGLKELGDYFNGMLEELDEKADEFGFLGSSTWIGNAKTSANSFLNVMYFKTPEDLHRYAHSEKHMKGWTWWSQVHAKYPHLSIFHETFAVPEGAYETIYMHMKPTLMAGTSVPIKTEQGTEWRSTVVDATKSPLNSHKGRMGKSDGTDNDKYGMY